MRTGHLTAARNFEFCGDAADKLVVEGLETLAAYQQIKNVCVNFSTH
jgi:hypothetical protein